MQFGVALNEESASEVSAGETRGVHLQQPVHVPHGVLGRAWSEATLLRVAHAFESATRYRRPPASVAPGADAASL